MVDGGGVKWDKKKRKVNEEKDILLGERTQTTKWRSRRRKEGENKEGERRRKITHFVKTIAVLGSLQRRLRVYFCSLLLLLLL
jgi:hypothetical protein